MKKKITAALLGAPLVLTGLTGQVLAQTGDSATSSANMLEEVIVTARKREESLQEIPVSLSVFGQDDIQAADLRSLQDVALMTPGLQMTNQANQKPGRAETQLQFRGLTTAQQSPSFATGALFIDGVYVLNGGTALSLMDIERVEVIKGPQAAYFGRNTFGGAVNLITRDPSMEEIMGEVQVRATDRSNNDISAIVELPLIENTLSASLSARYYDKRGQWVATDGGRMGNEETKAFNGVVKWNATERLEFKMRYAYSEDSDGPPAQGYVSGIMNDTCTGRVLNTPEGQAFPTRYICGQVPWGDAVVVDPGAKSLSFNTTLPPFEGLDALTAPLPNFPDAPRINNVGLERETERFTFLGTYAFDNGYSIDVTYGKNDQQSSILRDYDVRDRLGFFSIDPMSMDDDSIEVRLTSPQDQRLRWLVGYNRYEQEFLTSGEGGIVALTCYATIQTPLMDNYPDGCVGGAPGIFNLIIPLGLANADRAKVVGIFGALDYDFTDTLTLSMEGRFQDDTLTKGSGIASPDGQILQRSYDDFLPRVILRWTPTETTNLWGSFSQGQIAGDFNSTFLNADERERAQYLEQNPNLSESLDAETLNAWEVGIKQGFMGGRGQVNFSIYYYEWENIKGRSSYPINETCRPADIGAIGCDPDLGQAVGDPKRIAVEGGELMPFFTIRNTLLPGDATLNGAELELTYLFTDSLLWQLNAAYTDSEYDDYEFNFVTPVADFSQMKGNQTPRQPKWSGNTSLTWDFDLFDWPAYVRGDAFYKGEAFTDESNLAWIDDYWLFNLRVGVRTERFGTELFVTNLTDEKTWQMAARWSDWGGPVQFPHLTDKQGVAGIPLDRREFGVRLNYYF
ncbi:MAG TPA: TonB-dependent receptor [Woeseiaceae bacterium]|nr:TonB-dependent receptor [Woeseiaceae bacterium]